MKDETPKISMSGISTLAEIKMINNIETNGTITVYKDNKEITDNKVKVTTGMKLKISLNNENYEF